MDNVFEIVWSELAKDTYIEILKKFRIPTPFSILPLLLLLVFLS